MKKFYIVRTSRGDWGRSPKSMKQALKAAHALNTSGTNVRRGMTVVMQANYQMEADAIDDGAKFTLAKREAGWAVDEPWEDGDYFAPQVSYIGGLEYRGILLTLPVYHEKVIGLLDEIGETYMSGRGDAEFLKKAELALRS